MSSFACPFCGQRPLEEFSFHKTLANVPGGAFEEVYLRSDDPADSHEHWQHRYGCRAWLYVRRNPSTGQILAVRQLTGSSP